MISKTVLGALLMCNLSLIGTMYLGYTMYLQDCVRSHSIEEASYCMITTRVRNSVSSVAYNVVVVSSGHARRLSEDATKDLRRSLSNLQTDLMRGVNHTATSISDYRERLVRGATKMSTTMSECRDWMVDWLMKMVRFTQDYCWSCNTSIVSNTRATAETAKTVVHRASQVYVDNVGPFYVMVVGMLTTVIYIAM